MKTKQYIKEVNKFIGKLSEENKKKFENILFRIRFSKINDHDAEEFIHHCLDLFLQAEEGGIAVEEILGNNDIDSFCDEFIDETMEGYSAIEKIYWRVSRLPLIIFIFTGIFEMLVGYLIRAWVNGSRVFTVPVTLSIVVNTLIAITLTSYLLSNAAHLDKLFSDDKKTDMKITFLLWIGFCVLIAIFVLTKLFFTKVLFEINYLIFMGILIIICFIQHFVENRNQ
jgi:DNA-binding ferritin-like protein (Dps family)